MSGETEVMALHAKIVNLQSEMERQFVEVGKAVRELHQRGEYRNRGIEVLLRRVDELEAEIMQLRTEIQEKRNEGPDSATSPAADETAPGAPAPTPPSDTAAND